VRTGSIKTLPALVLIKGPCKTAMKAPFSPTSLRIDPQIPLSEQLVFENEQVSNLYKEGYLNRECYPRFEMILREAAPDLSQPFQSVAAEVRAMFELSAADALLEKGQAQFEQLRRSEGRGAGPYGWENLAAHYESMVARLGPPLGWDVKRRGEHLGRLATETLRVIERDAPVCFMGLGLELCPPALNQHLSYVGSDLRLIAAGHWGGHAGLVLGEIDEQDDYSCLTHEQVRTPMAGPGLVAVGIPGGCYAIRAEAVRHIAADKWLPRLRGALAGHRAASLSAWDGIDEAVAFHLAGFLNHGGSGYSPEQLVEIEVFEQARLFTKGLRSYHQTFTPDEWAMMTTLDGFLAEAGLANVVGGACEGLIHTNEPLTEFQKLAKTEPALARSRTLMLISDSWYFEGPSAELDGLQDFTMAGATQGLNGLLELDAAKLIRGIMLVQTTIEGCLRQLLREIEALVREAVFQDAQGYDVPQIRIESIIAQALDTKTNPFAQEPFNPWLGSLRKWGCRFHLIERHSPATRRAIIEASRNFHTRASQEVILKLAGPEMVRKCQGSLRAFVLRCLGAVRTS
jgi:hypothetical protein